MYTPVITRPCMVLLIDNRQNTIHIHIRTYNTNVCTVFIAIEYISLYPSQLMSVVSPERYWKELMDVHNPGVLEVFVGTNQQCYTPRVAYRLEVHG